MTVKLSIPATLLMAGSVGRQTIGSLGSSEDSTTGSLKKPTFSERHPKAIRSVTVIGYLFCVSLAAIVLSAYYVALWKPNAKESKHISNTTILPCFLPPTENNHNGIVRSYQYQRTKHSKYTSSSLGVPYRPPSATPKPLHPVIPEPSKLASHPTNSESLKQSNSTNNSLPENNSVQFGSVPLHDNIVSTTFPRTGTSAPADSTEEETEQPQQAYTDNYDLADTDSTFVPISTITSPRPNSIILQKILHGRKSIMQPEEHVYR